MKSACAPARQVADDALDGGSDDEIASLAKALAHPIRVQIVRLLARTEGCVNELVEQLPLAQSTVSQHLKVLKDAGLVVDQQIGRQRLYHVDPAGVGAMRAYFDRFWTKALANFAARAEAAGFDPGDDPRKDNADDQRNAPAGNG
ncbi:MAG TPA: metalloregulator ArsR/SmtB family transcription factor [Kofleriaceae bacterium]